MIRTPSLFALGIVSLLAPAYGQEPASDDPIARCAVQSASLADENACLRDAIRSLMSVSEAALSTAAPMTTLPQSSVENSTIVGAEAENQTVQVQADQVPILEQKPTGLGAEQVLARQERKAEKGYKSRRDDNEKGDETVMIDFAYAPSGQLILVMKNGQVWRQRSSDRQRVRLRDGEKTPVVIRRGALSGYRIDFTEKHRTITAERLQ